MDIRKKLDEFNKRWNIIDDSSYEEEFEKFRTRVLDIFHDIDSQVIEDGIHLFYQVMAIERDRTVDSKKDTPIFDALKKEKDEIRFYRLLQLISHLPFVRDMNASVHRKAKNFHNTFISNLSKAIKLSNINLSVAAIESSEHDFTDDKELVLYPRGEKELDVVLVNEVLSFLNEESQQHFVDALRFYQQPNGKEAIKSAESLRRALEEFLRFKLENTKGLKENIRELPRQLKKDGRDPKIREIISQVFSYLDGYFNENSKHNDGDITEAENEFLIYQIGLLMRYTAKVVRKR